MERWKLILKEAAEQSGRGLIPELVSARNFSEGLEMIQKLDLGLFAWEQEEKEGLQDILHRKELRRIGVIIGPEGGFTDEEYHQAVSAGWKSISLGRRILRMETAALVASALIISTFEKLG
jgi:16S rRNA (uracil1498-N3)-methyltransferase